MYWTWNKFTKVWVPKKTNKYPAYKNALMIYLGLPQTVWKNVFLIVSNLIWCCYILVQRKCDEKNIGLWVILPNCKICLFKFIHLLHLFKTWIKKFTKTVEIYRFLKKLLCTMINLWIFKYNVLCPYSWRDKIRPFQNVWRTTALL